MVDERPVANAGYAITGSGGGGNGQYVFASLEALNEIKNQWIRLRDDIVKDGRSLGQALSGDLAPARDVMSQQQANALTESINKAIEHNEVMANYAESYIEKLDAALKQYAADDQAAALRFERTDEA